MAIAKVGSPATAPARQKQVDECLSRCLARQQPLPGHKLSAFLDNNLLTLNHYHHKLLVYDLQHHRPVHEWWEKPTDRRILGAALAYLEQEVSAASCSRASRGVAY